MSDPSAASAPHQRESWDALLDRLEADLPKLTETYLSQVRLASGYEPGALVGREDLQAMATESLGLLIESIRTGETPAALLELAETLGRRRAQQQVPADSLTMAMQSDFNVLWSRLLELASEIDASDSAGGADTVLMLAQQVEPIWRAVEVFSNSTMTHYRQEELRLAQDRLNHRQVAIGRLLSFRSPSAASVAWVASELDCNGAAAFTVLVADQEETRSALFELASSLRRSRFYFYRSLGSVVAFWPSDETPPQIEQALVGLRCARANRVDGLACLPRTVTMLTTLLETVDPDVRRTIDLSEGFPQLARRALLTQGIDLEGRLANALRDSPDAERERLQETVIAFLETGSVQQTAAALFYHRNTVLKRLNKFTELTGIDVTVPVEAATAVLAWSEISDRPGRTL